MRIQPKKIPPHNGNRRDPHAKTDASFRSGFLAAALRSFSAQVKKDASFDCLKNRQQIQHKTE
jgi:hypothetical protein